MGESGAGKTSLLDMLAGRKTVGELGGEITVNGRPRGKDWQRISGYVMQDDLMLPSLTVRETVLFSVSHLASRSCTFHFCDFNSFSV